MYCSIRQFLSHLELPSGCDNTQVLLGEVVLLQQDVSLIRTIGFRTLLRVGMLRLNLYDVFILLFCVLLLCNAPVLWCYAMYLRWFIH